MRINWRREDGSPSCDVLYTRCPLDYGRHPVDPIKSKVGLGKLDKLPTELQHQILLDVDVRTLLGFRRVNQSAMKAVDGILEWKKVRTRMTDCL